MVSTSVLALRARIQQALAVPLPGPAFDVVDHSDKLHAVEGWFFERNHQWPGISCSLEVDEVLHNEKSDYQHVIVFRSKTFGHVLVLDGVIQYTERDEFAYQEMMAHPALFSHPDPRRVLIIGGGDGGVLREVLKHACVQEVVMCEIDKMVIECAKRYFPSVKSAFADPRFTLVCDDATKFITTVERAFDLIVCDSSDPDGPAEQIFESPFYQAMYNALRPGGRISTQAESIWLHLDLIQKLVAQAGHIFQNVGYMTTQIPTYPCGQIGVLQCLKSQDEDKPHPLPFSQFKKPVRAIPEDFPTRYYSAEVHAAAFRLPRFLTNALQQVVAMQ